MKKIGALLLLSLLLAIPVIGARLKGRVLDSAKQALAGVTTQILQLPDSARKAYGITNERGIFNFKDIKPGSYTVRLSMVGMDDLFQNFSVDDTTKVVNLGDLTMSETAVMLKEAVITGIKTDVIAKQDTVEFNAGSFKTQANASVEDLLKKLPGVEVDSDGKIKSGGKTVSKILVDGKEFFGGDTQMATKNLPSELVDKVQVVDRKSDLARLTGVDDGEEETVINLTVKKGMKNGWFGNLGAGYGSDKHYEGKFNISTFTDNNQISIVGGGNNINDLGFGDTGRGRFGGFGGNNGLTTAERIGLNFNLGKDENFRVGGNVFYSHSDRTAQSDTYTQFLYSDSTSNQVKDAISRSQDIGHNVRGDFRVEWKIDKNNTLDFRPSFGVNKRDAEQSGISNLFFAIGNQQVNKDVSKSFNGGTGYDLGGRLIFNHNFESRPGRSFSLAVNYDLSDTKQHTTSWNKIDYYMKQVAEGKLSYDEYYRYIDNHQWTNSVGTRLSYTEPIGDAKNGNFLQAAYRMRYNFNNADKYTYNIPIPELLSQSAVQNFTSLPSGSILDNINTNRFRNTASSQEIQLGYKKVNKDYNLNAGVSVIPSSNESENLTDPNKNIPGRWVWNMGPYANMRYKFSKTASLRLDYRGRTSQPSLSQLQPVADVSNPMNIIQGNPDLKPSFSQNFGVNFNNFNTETQQSFMAMINGNYSINDVISKTITELGTGVRTTTYENQSGNYSAFGMVMMNQPIGNKKWRINLHSGANTSSSASYINGEFNRSHNYGIRPSIGLTFQDDLFRISANPTFGWTAFTSSIKSQENRYTQSYGVRSDAALYLPFGLTLNTDFYFSKQTGYSAGYNKDTYLWNAQISYSMLADKSLTLSVRAYDLLNCQNYISHVESPGQIVDTNTLGLKRYVMFGIAYTFNTMKNKTKQNAGPDDLMAPPHGVERGRGSRSGGMMIPMGGHF